MENFLLEDFKNHLTFERQLSKNTVASYGSDVESFLEYCQANEKDPLKIEPDFLDQYNYQLRVVVKLAPASVFRKMEAVKCFYKFLLIEEKIKDDPTRFLKSPKLAQHMVKELSPDNILFLISTGGVFPPTLALARIAAMRQIPVIAISPYEVNTLSTLAQYNLRFFTIQRENSGAELTSRLPLFYLISALIRCYVFYKDGIRL